MSSPQFNLSEDLIGEGIAHDKAGMTSSAAQVYKPTLSKQDNVTSIW